jgi:hypothetical protein
MHFQLAGTVMQPQVPFPSDTSVVSAPNSGLSPSEDRIMTRVLELLTGPLHSIVDTKLAEFSTGLSVQIGNIVSIAVAGALDHAVEKAVDIAVERIGVAANSHESSTTSSGTGVGTGLTTELWLCPFCLLICKNEHSFDEHIKKVLSKLTVDSFRGLRVVRRSESVKRPICVFDPADSVHQQYIVPWKRRNPSADDYECCRSFICGMRQLLTPGAHKGFASSTGHIHDVFQYVDSCVKGSLSLSS